jgi:ribose transport system ATP-binding protein
MTIVDTKPLALHLSGVGKSFPGVRALDNVELNVRFGEVHGVLGENGAGKSTLMAIASGALSADSGHVEIAGELLKESDPVKARQFGLAIVRQEPALFPHLSVAENLYLGVSPDKRPGSHRLTEWARSILEVWSPSVSIKPDDRVEQLLPQQRFIVDICRALAQDPKVLILDEPTEHLLRDEVDILFGHVRNQIAQGKGVVYISHRINEVKAITDRLTVLRNGKTVGTFPTDGMGEEDIVNRIIGRDLDVYFPEKNGTPGADYLELNGFATQGLAPMTATFRRGEIVGLAGIEGNGQRDLLRALAALQPTTGSVSVGGRRHSRWGHRAATKESVVFLTGDRKNEGILPTLSVGENISYRSLARFASAGFVSGKKELEFQSQVVHDYRVKTPTLDTPIESLSGGNQQKALFGAALSENPSIFLIDEPTQGIDIGARTEIYALMRRAADDGAVVIMLSSDSTELAGVVDKVLVFSRGHVIKSLEGDISERDITGAILSSDTERTRGGAARRRFTDWLASDTAPLALISALIVGLVVVGAASSPNFLGTYNIAGILALTAVLGFVAFGQLLVLLAGGFDLSVGPVIGLVVNIASFYLIDGATPGEQLGGWALMIGAALAIGFINWALIEFGKLNPLIATLITFMGVQGISFILRPSPGGQISSAVLDPISMRFGPIPLAFIALVIVAIAFGVALKRTHPGIILRATGSDVTSAGVAGIRSRYVQLFAYLGCSALAAAAAVFYMAQTATGDARGGLGLVLLSVTAAVVGGASLGGGRGSFFGALLGALLVQIVNALTIFLRVSDSWQFYMTAILTLGAVALYSWARRRAAVRE